MASETYAQKFALVTNKGSKHQCLKSLGLRSKQRSRTTVEWSDTATDKYCMETT